MQPEDVTCIMCNGRRLVCDSATARARLNAVTFAEAWESGQKLTLEQVINFALNSGEEAS